MASRANKFLLLVVAFSLAITPLRAAFPAFDDASVTTAAPSHCDQMDNQSGHAPAHHPIDHGPDADETAAHDCETGCNGSCCEGSCNACTHGVSTALGAAPSFAAVFTGAIHVDSYNTLRCYPTEWLWRYIMFHYRNTVRPAATLVALLALSTPSWQVSAALTLTEAERIALGDDPAVAASQARSQALREESVAAGQLPDPKLKAGLFNLPLDDFDIDREPTTQLRLGLQQAFPRGATLKHRQRQAEWKATSEQARSEDESRKLLREVRTNFLELYYQLGAERVVNNTRALFEQLVDITQVHYATGRVSQQDVLRASLELSRLDDRATRIRNAQDKNRASLAQWIGDAATQKLDARFPTLPALSSRSDLDAALERHPVIQAESARIESQNQAVQIAREQYKPGWGVGLEYRKRFGENPDDTDRSDMLAAMVTVDLPLFPKKRQDRRLAASLQEAEAAQLMRSDRLRDLRAMLESDYASWERLGERADLYETRLLREARDNAQASLNAYQSGVTEFTTLMRARMTDLDIRLDDLRVRVDRAKTQARLIYLAGESR